MRLLAALLAMVLVAPAPSSGQRPAPSPQPVPIIRVVPLPTPALESGRAEYRPSPAEIEASGAPEFQKCTACHTLAPGSPHRLGPNLHGVFGRPAAADPGYFYSPELRASGLVWDDETLDRWLAGPRTLVPGTRMTFHGIADPEKRRAVIAFLGQRPVPAP